MDLNHFPKEAIAEETGTTVMSGTFSIHQHSKIHPDSTSSHLQVQVDASGME